MEGKMLYSNFVLSSKVGSSRQESASKVATSQIRKPICTTLEKPTKPE